VQQCRQEQLEEKLITRKLFSVVVTLAMILSLLGAALPAVAQDEGGAIQLAPSPADRAEKGSESPKLDSLLNRLVSAATPEAKYAIAQSSDVRLVDDSVQVVIECRADTVDAVAAIVAGLGTIETSYLDLLQASVPVSQLETLAGMTDVLRVRIPQRAIPTDTAGDPAVRTGTINSEGVGVINADDWHTAGFTGAGVKIGVLDGGFAGYVAELGGELPASVTAQSFRADTDIEAGSAHGTACAEVVYDVAPGADLYLANYGTDVELGNAVDWMVAEGVDVISHSMAWPAGGLGDGTGPICTIVNNARTSGILWAQSAGNSAQRHWQGPYLDTDADNWHEFDPGVDESNAIVVSTGDTITVTLMWDDPWGASANDYELYLYEDGAFTPGLEVAYSWDTQDGSGDPIEGLSYVATYDGLYHIAIENWSGDGTATFTLLSWRHNLQYQVAAGSLTTPADAVGALTVGAVPWFSPDTLEPYSSRGPTEDSRIKPDIVAPDCVSTTSYGPFCGTSASTPHAAGAAALVLERFPAYDADDTQTFLEDGAVDLGDAGKDNLFGSGILDLGFIPPAWQIEYIEGEVGLIDVGTGTSIAADSLGKPHISYSDGTNRDLKYARWDGAAWQIETVDGPDQVGTYTSLALDSLDRPHIAYSDYTNDDLKYARWDGAAWQVATVDTGGDFGLVGMYTSLGVDSSDHPHISHNEWAADDSLKYARFNGTTWQNETVDSTGDVGMHTSLALDSSDRPHISYFDLANEDLKYIYYNGTIWNSETVDSTGDVGRDNSLVLDSSDRPHVSYWNNSSYDLKYASFDGTSWQIETVDSGDNVGANSSLALDSWDNPHISYRDSVQTALKHAWRGEVPEPEPDIYVDASNTGDPLEDGSVAHPFDLIQEGINAASSGVTTVHVAAGTYTENLDFTGKDITIQGTDGAETTIVNGGSAGSCVRFVSGETADAVLDGFTLTNGSGTLIDATQRFGGGVYIYDGASPTITNSIISGNSSQNGGGIKAWYASATISNSIIRGNSSSGNGGGIGGSFGGDFTVVNSIVAGNHSGAYGGGIRIGTDSNAIIINSTIVGNDAVHGGGGISGYTTVLNSIVRGNTAGSNPNVPAGVTITYSNIEGGYAGTGNINADPLFADAAGGDYHLQSGSPCIDMGTNIGAPLTDYEGDPRPIDGDGDTVATADMGADEYVPTSVAAWTFMVYMAADNNLSDAGLDDLNEMEVAGSTGEVDIVALLDLEGDGNTTLYHVENEATPSTAIVSTPLAGPFAAEVNMGDPAVLQEFVEWTIANYPADNYALVLWNHGEGWRTTADSGPLYKGVCFDDLSGDYISTVELGAVLDTATTNAGETLDIIGFDACLMAMAEVAWEIHTSGSVMVGSEEVEPWDGWPYDTILIALTTNPTLAPADVAAGIVALYAASYAALPAADYVTMSAVDLTQMPGVVTTLDAFAAAMMASTEWANILMARIASEWFYDADYVDLYDFAEKVSLGVTETDVINAATDLMAVILPAVLSEAHGSDHPDATGLSIYLPLSGALESAYALLDLSNGLWDEFLAWFLAAPPPPTWVEVLNDPAGDQFAGTGPDILGVDSALAADTISFQVRTNGAIDFANFWAATLLDTDEDDTTGAPGRAVGAEYLVYVSSGPMLAPDGAVAEPDDRVGPGEPWALLLEWVGPTGDDFEPVAQLPVFTDTTSCWTMVPLALLGPDDGSMDVQQVVGTIDPNTATDMVPGEAPEPIPWHMIIDDGLGDGITGADISVVLFNRTPERIGLRVIGDFDFSMDFFTAATYLDTDQDDQTGEPVNDIGADFRIVLYGGDAGEPLECSLGSWTDDFGGGFFLVSALSFETGSVNGDSFFDIYCDLDLLGPDDGNMDLVEIVYDPVAVVEADIAPDEGHASVGEPQWFTLIEDSAGDGPPDLIEVAYAKKVTRPEPPMPTVLLRGDPTPEGRVFFRVDAGGMDFDNLVGETLLDIDSDAGTGAFVNDIGVDYVARVESGSLIGTLLSWNGTSWDDEGHFDVFPGTEYYWFGIDFSRLANPDASPEDGYMDVVQTIGTLVPEVITDVGPNVGHGSIAPRTLEEALDDGLAWLAAQQNPDGSWGSDLMWSLAKTALAVYKLEMHGYSLYPDPFDAQYGYQYLPHILAGLDYIFAHGYIIDISDPQPAQPAGYVDGAPVEFGVFFDELGDGHGEGGGAPTYNTAICLLAIAASGHPEFVVTSPGNDLDTWGYGGVMGNVVDYLAWGQTDFGYGRGGWSYGHTNASGDRSDESNTGWVTLALAAAEEYGFLTPGWVRGELDLWVNYIQDPTDGDTEDGGAYYTGPGEGAAWVNMLRTGNLLQQQAFLGDTTASPRVQNALAFIENNWNQPLDYGWRGTPSSYHTTYTVMKGLEALGIADIGSPPFDWFQDFVDALLAEQFPDGSWPMCPWDDGDQILATEWALLTLQREIPETREAPDLVIIEKTEEWINQPEGIYVVTAILKNVGNLPVTEPNHHVTLLIDGAPAEILNIQLIDFAPGDTIPLIFGGQTPFQVTGGDDEIIVCADTTHNTNPLYENLVDELNEQNNCRINHVPPLPDLTISEKEEEWVDQGFYIVHFTLQNSGNVTIPAGHTVGLFIDSGPAPVALIQVMQPLGPGEIYPATFATAIVLSGTSDDVMVCADANGEVSETDEQNNCLTNWYPEEGDIDLVVLTKAETWVDGQENVAYTVSFVVKNDGTGTAAAGHDVGLSIDGVAQAQTVVVNQALAPGATFAGTFATPIQLSGGDDDIVVCTDVNSEIAEVDEQNNCLSNTIHSTAEQEACVNLVDGWNIVALEANPATSFTASTLAADINAQGGNVTQVFWWNAAAGTWDFYLVDLQYGTDFTIEIGYGYLLMNTVAATWCYTGTPLTTAYIATVDPVVTNVADKSFTVSWVSQNAEEGHVIWGTDPGTLDQTAYDDRDTRPAAVFTDDTHHVTIAGLAASTTYYFSVVSGGTTHDDGGVPFELTTGPGLAFNLPVVISGSVFLADGSTAAEGTIVYTRIGTDSSQVLSALVNSSGTWAMDIASVRTTDFQSYYSYTDADSMPIDAQGAADGLGSQIVTVAEAKAGAPSMTVSLTAELELVISWNLIALPVLPATTFTASTMAADINAQGGAITQVFWWNALAGTWDFWLVDLSYGTDFTIEMGEGYLLSNGTAVTWEIPAQ